MDATPLPRYCLFVDGATGGRDEGTGLGSVVKDEQGTIVSVHKHHADSMTCNEAEYHALLMGLRAQRGGLPCHLDVYTDSQIVVMQMTGQAEVRSPGLQRVHADAQMLIAEFGSVSFHHIAREENLLAHALATEALSEMAIRPEPSTTELAESQADSKETGSRRPLAPESASRTRQGSRPGAGGGHSSLLDQVLSTANLQRAWRHTRGNVPVAMRPFSKGGLRERPTSAAWSFRREIWRGTSWARNPSTDRSFADRGPSARSSEL